MKIIEGVPQFKEEIWRDVVTVYEINQQLREFFSEMKCVNCINFNKVA